MRKYAFDAIISRSAPDLRESGYKSREAGARQEQGSSASGGQVSNQAASNI